MAEKPTLKVAEPPTTEQIAAHKEQLLTETRSKRASTFAFWFVFFGIFSMLFALHTTGYLDQLPEQADEVNDTSPLVMFGLAATAAFFPIWGYLLGCKIGWWLYRK